MTLTILRGEESFPLSVERRSIQTPVATYEMLNGQIGYLKIANFDSRCAEETNAAMDELIAQGAQALIFDVRYNGGGYKDELVKVLDKILPEGILFQSEDYKGTKQTDRSDAACIKLPMAVLVNQDSYSAAEFFAAAIQEYNWGTVVGTKTVGKGNFQTAFTLSDGSMLNLSIGKYYTPQGRSLTDTASYRTSKSRFPTRTTQNFTTVSWKKRTTHNYRPQSAKSPRNSLDIPIFARYNVC